jgi:hypothetical protein
MHHVSESTAETQREADALEAWRESWGEDERRARAVFLEDALATDCVMCGAYVGQSCRSGSRSDAAVGLWAHLERRASYLGLDARDFEGQRKIVS